MLCLWLLYTSCREQDDYALLHIYEMADLQKKVMDAVTESGKGDEKLPYRVEPVSYTHLIVILAGGDTNYPEQIHGI